MEKLQAALQKARSRRQNDPTEAPVRKTTARPATDRVGHLWQDLHEIKLPASIQDQHVVTQEAGNKATPFDILRTKILLQMRENGWKSLAITSPMPKSGKTTMACNLALGLGRQSGVRTILFDLDLQDPSLHTFLDHTPQADITDVLAGKASFADQALRVGDNVAISMNRSAEKDPTRILQAQQTVQTLQEIKETYAPDVVIFDTPSILVSDNTRAFLKNVDCALIVVRANSTDYGDFDACEREVAAYTNVLGTVLNAFRTKAVQS